MISKRAVLFVPILPLKMASGDDDFLPTVLFRLRRKKESSGKLGQTKMKVALESFN